MQFTAKNTAKQRDDLTEDRQRTNLMATIFDAHRAAAVQDLNARVAHADGVRVVAMLLVGLAGVPRPEQLDAVDRSVLRI